jgi:hypothetical protein
MLSVNKKRFCVRLNVSLKCCYEVMTGNSIMYEVLRDTNDCHIACSLAYAFLHSRKCLVQLWLLHTDVRVTFAACINFVLRGNSFNTQLNFETNYLLLDFLRLVVTGKVYELAGRLPGK